jgi:hypothetical protein
VNSDCGGSSRGLLKEFISVTLRTGAQGNTIASVRIISMNRNASRLFEIVFQDIFRVHFQLSIAENFKCAVCFRALAVGFVFGTRQ